MGGNFLFLWEPIWFKGSQLPNPDDAVHKSSEYDMYWLKNQGQLMNLK